MERDEKITQERKSLANTIINIICQFYRISKINIVSPPKRKYYYYRNISIYFVYELLKNKTYFNQSHVIDLFPTINQRSVVPKYYNQVKSQIGLIPSFRKEMKSLENFIYAKSVNIETIRRRIDEIKKQQPVRNVEIILNYIDGTTHQMTINNAYHIELIQKVIKKNTRRNKK